MLLLIVSFIKFLVISVQNVRIFPKDKMCDSIWLNQNETPYILVDSGEPNYPHCS